MFLITEAPLLVFNNRLLISLELTTLITYSWEGSKVKPRLHAQNEYIPKQPIFDFLIDTDDCFCLNWVPIYGSDMMFFLICLYELK